MSRSRSRKSKSRKVNRLNHNLDRIWQAFNPNTLRRICEMDEHAFAQAFDMATVDGLREGPNDFYNFRDNGANVLAVAHLDTVSDAADRRCNIMNTAGGMVVFSRALDDRLGAYVILDLLPRLGINVDLLLTVGEESGQSTASFFDPPKDKDYDWIIEFDRGGTDVVMYQFEDKESIDLVKATGAKVGDGIFSDICYLEHLDVKAFNWGVGYRDYHSDRSHAWLDDTFKMVSYFMDFYATNAGIRMDHVERPRTLGYGYGSGYGSRYGSNSKGGYFGLGFDDDDDEIVLSAEEIADAEADAEFAAWQASFNSTPRSQPVNVTTYEEGP